MEYSIADSTYFSTTAHPTCSYCHIFLIQVHLVPQLCQIEFNILNILVYYGDRALRLALPPRSSFSKQTASRLVLRLMQSARQMLFFEQKRVQAGSPDDGQKLIDQFIGMLLLSIC